MYRKLTITRLLLPAIALLTLLSAVSCLDTEELENRLDSLENRIAAMEEQVKAVNNDAIVIHKLLDDKIVITGTTDIVKDNTVIGYTIDFSDGDKLEVIFGDRYAGVVPIIGIDAEGYWSISMDNGETFERMEGDIKAGNAGKTPSFRIDDEGFWTYTYDGTNYNRVLDDNGNPISIDGNKMSDNSAFRDVQYDEATGIMTFVLQSGGTYKVAVINTFFIRINVPETNSTLCLGETKKYEAKLGDVKELSIKSPQGWTATFEDNVFTVTAPSIGSEEKDCTFTIFATSTNNYLKTVEVVFHFKPIELDANACKTWNDFASGSSDVLLDYSYAGYSHGETAPPDVNALGYTVYDITQYGAIANDGQSDREAFLSVLKEIFGEPNTANNHIAFNNKPSAKAIVYFPEGDFILHTAEDDIEVSEKKESQTIIIRSGDFIIKGAGREKTKLIMQDCNQPKNPADPYSSPEMIQLAHWTSFLSASNFIGDITAGADRGTFSVTVGTVAGIKPGDWVCLFLSSDDKTLLAEELEGKEADSEWVIGKSVQYDDNNLPILGKGGVEVTDYHQVAAVSGNTVTFKEPIMHAVNASYGWKLYKYPNQKNVGVEDLTFAGNAKEDFVHHAGWEDDGGFKPLTFTRCTDSWLRRVDFISVSEACSFINSANCSAYDINFTGNRGHASIRSQGSSRIFIGATKDETAGYLAGKGNGYKGAFMENTGNYHAVGVSKTSMGAVLWRNVWGNDSCFESHASQPRASLFDHCSGGWMRWRQGGAKDQLPNHLGDLTIWNFNATSGDQSGQENISGNFIWWDNSDDWWRNLPATVVGFHGSHSVTFADEENRHEESTGTSVYPESLYEAQLRKRLGYVPAWLESLK